MFRYLLPLLAVLHVATPDGWLDIIPDEIKDFILDRLIFPGTLWCGPGNKATSDDELGHFANTDRCCRSHDRCPDNMPGCGELEGLQNPSLFTRSHCDCDEAFFYCLKNVSEFAAKKIGLVFFDVLGVKCFQLGYQMNCTWGAENVICEEDTSTPKKNRFYYTSSFIDPPKKGEPFLQGSVNDE